MTNEITESLSFLLATDDWIKLNYHINNLKSGAKFGVWRIARAVSPSLVSSIKFPVNLYFFKNGEIRYRAKLVDVTFTPSPLEYIPEEFRSENYPAKTHFWMSELMPLASPIPIYGLRNWKKPDKLMHRAYCGYYVICDPLVRTPA